jgi:hypothetical protein
MCVVLLYTAGVGAQGHASGEERLRGLLATAGQDMATVNHKYVGPGSCSAVACHGGIQPHMSTPGLQQGVLQNEYSTWVTEDQHAHAYTALTEPLGRQMSAILKIGPAEKAPRCLTCHALEVEEAHKARAFDVAEGVSCESCHGPASEWLGPHIDPNKDRPKLLKAGLVDNRNLAVRTERCLSCHLGSARKDMQVDHEMIAAGHPDLTFELDSFTAKQPPHWVERDKNPLFGMRAWGVGQAVQLRESMLRVARRAKTGPWPEFSEMDCITCHHSLTGPESWRQKEGYDGHRAGDPPYNVARFVVFKRFAEEIDPATERELAVEVERVAKLMTSMSTDRAAVESAADKAARLAGKLVGEMDAAPYDKDRAQRLIRAITSDADAISRQGERVAEQATMTVDALYIASAKAGAGNAGTRAAIDQMFVQVKNPSGYNGPAFALAMKRVGASVR